MVLFYFSIFMQMYFMFTVSLQQGFYDRKIIIDIFKIFRDISIFWQTVNQSMINNWVID